MPVHLTDYPVELLCRILVHLDVLDLYHCCLTCSFIRTIINVSTELQLQFQLGINRMVCFQPLTEEPTISTRLELLKRHRHAWRYLQWKDTATLEFNHAREMYEYVGGIYAVGDFQSISMFQLHPISDEQRSPIPIAWTHNMDLLVCKYATDSTQDLMIIVEISALGSEFVLTSHMRTMSTNEPHPKAATLTHGSMSRSRSDYHFTLSPQSITTARIAGDFVGLLVREVIGQIDTYIEIWNWTKGTTFSHRSELIKLGGVNDLSFLSFNTFLITCPNIGTIEIYEFEDPAVSCNGPSHKSIFELPLLHPENSYSSVYADTFPLVTRPWAPNPIPPLHHPLFSPSPENRICVVYIPLFDHFGNRFPTSLFIHSRVFFGLDPGVSAFLKESQGNTIPWKFWGPQNTRWYPTDWSGWRYSSYGLKVIDSVRQDEDLESADRRIRLRDYNSYAFASLDSDDDKTLQPWQKGTVVKESSYIHAPFFFAEEVESYLPYREVLTEEIFDFSEIIMDEIQIVLFKQVFDLNRFTMLRISG